MSKCRHVPWVSLVSALLLVAGPLAIYVVIFPRPDVVDGPNPIVLGYASFVLAALCGIRLGAALHCWLGHDDRLARVGADPACVALVAGVTQGTGWLLEPDFFGVVVLRIFVRSVLVFGVTVVTLREVARGLVRTLRRRRGRGTDTAHPSHD